MSVVIETTIGDITVDLYLEERPRTCLNFIKLCKIKYYHFCLFHKIERNFIAQTGDPSGTGRGGESIFSHMYGEQAKYFEAESKPRIKHKKLGTLSMVNSGNNMTGSQFFITLGEDLTYLDGEHTVFGEVAEGFEILVKLNDAICDTNSRPYQDIRITHMVILHDPYDDPSNLEVPPSSPIPTKEILASDYVGADEDIDDNRGRSIAEIEEEIKDKEAKARATILEMVGDIPDADVKPPENVLFVCKLNPVTTDEDLEIIFSRFGVIKSCEVIKDKKTDESLQYAFIEFEREEDCENAYFKMDNVLIDDRRIHVDFSQSVAKLKFDKQNRPIIENRAPRREKLVIKDRSRVTDNYEMIFDSDDGLTAAKEHIVEKKKKHPKKRHSRSPRKHRKKSSTEQSLKPRRHSRSSSDYSSKRSPSDHPSKSKYRATLPDHSPKSKDYSKSSSNYISESKHRKKSPSDHSLKPKYQNRSPINHPSSSKYLDRSSSDHSRSKHHSPSPSNHTSKVKNNSKSPNDHSSRSKNRSRSSNDHSSRSKIHSRSPNDIFSKSKYHNPSPSDHTSRSKNRSRSPNDTISRSKYHNQSPSDHATKSKNRSRSPNDTFSRSKYHNQSPSDHTSKSKNRSRSPNDTISKSKYHNQSPSDHASTSKNRSRSPNNYSSKSRRHSISPQHKHKKHRNRTYSSSSDESYEKLSSSKHKKKSHHK